MLGHRLVCTVLLVVGTAACGPLAGAPNPPETPFPTAQRPLLRKQVRDLRAEVDRLTHLLPNRQITERKVLDDHERACYFHDPDDPTRGPTTHNWEYAVRVGFDDSTTAAERDDAVKEQLRKDGWTLGSGYGGDLVAVKRGMYLEILLSVGTHGPQAIRGFSRCVRADGKIMTPEIPATRSPR
jgi:hypothetical protein